MRHILEVIDQAGNQAAAEVTPATDSADTDSATCLSEGCERVLRVAFRPHSPHKKAEEAEECVHQPHVVGDAGDDGLLTVRTHGVHRRRLEHLPLQHRHRGGGRVSSHLDKRAGTGPHLSRHWMRKVTRWRGVHRTCGPEEISHLEPEINLQDRTLVFYTNFTWGGHGHGHGHGGFSWYMWGNKARLLSFIRGRAVIWRKRRSGNRSGSYWFTKIRKKACQKRLKSSFH